MLEPEPGAEDKALVNMHGTLYVLSGKLSHTQLKVSICFILSTGWGTFLRINIGGNDWLEPHLHVSCHIFTEADSTTLDR